jgi:hypothetical protein
VDVNVENKQDSRRAYNGRGEMVQDRYEVFETAVEFYQIKSEG